MNTETYDHPVTEAMRRMRAFVLARGPLLMKTGQHLAGVGTEQLSVDQRASILARIRAGEPYTALAREFAVDPKTIYHIACRHNIVRRRPISEAMRADIRDKRFFHQWSVRNLALHHGISISAVRQILRPSIS